MPESFNVLVKIRPVDMEALRGRFRDQAGRLA